MELGNQHRLRPVHQLTRQKAPEMNDDSHDSQTTLGNRSSVLRPWHVAAAMLALIAGFYLLREHWGHVVGSWPYPLLLACPLMHLMHGHGGHGHHQHRDASRDGGSPSSNQG